MPFRALRLTVSLGLLALTLTTLSSAFADEPSPSLYARRLGIIKGTSKGVVLWESDKLEHAPAAAIAAPAPADSRRAATADSTPGAAAPEPPLKSRFLSPLPPPSGRSMNDARRLGAPGGGIQVPTAHKTASEPQAEPAVKP